MKKISVFICMILAANVSVACDEVYLKVGAGYKFDEQKKVRLEMDSTKIYEIQNSPYSARFETGVECGNISYGISHHSQWATGAPFNSEGEYYKTEFFIDYKFSWPL